MSAVMKWAANKKAEKERSLEVDPMDCGQTQESAKSFQPESNSNSWKDVLKAAVAAVQEGENLNWEGPEDLD